MSTAVQQSARSVRRMIAIPLTRPPPPTLSSPHLTGLTYYHFQIHEQAKKTVENPNAVARGFRWAQKKAVDTWTGWGKAPEGTWKLRVFKFGERLTDRIDFEELALKGVDPSLGPKLTNWRRKGSKDSSATSGPVEAGGQEPIPLLYPPSIIQSPDIALADLQHLVENRSPRHKRGFYLWLFVTPFTFPLKFIPIIPNLPFFYCAWRVWSHYRAYKASDYLHTLIESGGILPRPSLELDRFYTVEKESPSEDTPLLQGREALLLSTSSVVPLVETFGLKPDASVELSRALVQAKARVLKEA